MLFMFLIIVQNSKGWSVEDMFSVNREKFQVTSNFDEDLSQYTYVRYCQSVLQYTL